MDLGIGAALVSAVLTQLGFLCKHRGANDAPAVELRRPLGSAGSLLRSRWFALGMLVAGGAWLLHVIALALAPLSTVQAVLATGVVLLAVLGDRIFGCPVSRRQWIGIAMTTVGLIALVATLPAPETERTTFALPGMIAFEAMALALGALLIAAPWMGTPVRHHGALLGGAAGMLFGVGDVSLKALTAIAAGGPLAVLASPWLPVAIVSAALAFLASARGFQQGAAVPVIAFTTTAANVTCIVGGIVVFGDVLAGGLLLFVQLAAFGLVAGAALLTPAGHGHSAAVRATA